MNLDLLVYLAHVIFYAPFLPRLLAARTGESVKKAPGARPLVLLHSAAFFVTYFGIGVQVFSHTAPYVENWRRILGAAVILASGALAAWALLVFRSWRFSAELDAKHELCTDGPFRSVRHPIYVALAGLAIGTAIWITNPFTIAGAVLNLVAGDLRGRSEEKLLAENFGESYRLYLGRVKRFIPFLYVMLLAVSAQAASDRLPPTGLEVKSLDDKGQGQLLQLLDKYSSPCGRAHSLYTSLTTDKACKRAPFAGRFLVFLVGLGLTPEEIAQHYEDRFVTPHTGHCKPGGFIRGDDKAAITLCEFTDFQCPHCKAAEPMLKKVLEDYKGKVRLQFKNFPLSSHPDARNAAAAAVAAGYQGKFWPMHDRLFEHQDKMSAADLEHDARELKLDVQKWYADLPAAGTQVDAERGEGLTLQIDHTPTIYIGDREYRGPLRYEFFKDWIDEALAR